MSGQTPCVEVDRGFGQFARSLLLFLFIVYDPVQTAGRLAVQPTRVETDRLTVLFSVPLPLR